MPNLTPIALSEDEHEKLVSLKHKLEANSWREMLMKLCDIYEEYSQLKASTQTETTEGNPISEDLKNYIENLVEEKLQQKPENPKEEGLLSKMLDNVGNKKKVETEMHEEQLTKIVRKVVREELDGHKFEVEIPEHNHKPKVETEPCPSCKRPLDKNKQPKYCPNCEEELQWED